MLSSNKRKRSSNILYELTSREYGKSKKNIKYKSLHSYILSNAINNVIKFENIGLEYSMDDIRNVIKRDIYGIKNNYKRFIFLYIKYIILSENKLYYLDLDTASDVDKITLFNANKEQFNHRLEDISNNDGSIKIRIDLFLKPKHSKSTHTILTLYKTNNSYLIIKDSSNTNEKLKKIFASVSSITDINIKLKFTPLHLPQFIEEDDDIKKYIELENPLNEYILKINKIYYDVVEYLRSPHTEQITELQTAIRQLEYEYKSDSESESEEDRRIRTGGSNNKYKICSNKKTNYAYINYNKKKSYFYENENKIYINIDNKIIHIIKKSLNYDKKTNNNYLNILN